MLPEMWKNNSSQVFPVWRDCVTPPPQSWQSFGAASSQFPLSVSTAVRYHPESEMLLLDHWQLYPWLPQSLVWSLSVTCRGMPGWREHFRGCVTVPKARVSVPPASHNKHKVKERLEQHSSLLVTPAAIPHGLRKAWGPSWAGEAF